MLRLNLLPFTLKQYANVTGFWRPMQFTALCIRPSFARPISTVRDKSEHCENGERYACGNYVEPIGSQQHRATQGTRLQPSIRQSFP